MALMKSLRISTVFRNNFRHNTTAATNNDAISAVFTNRNPRNLEKLRIAYKPNGYHVDKPGRSYWHKLLLKRTGRHVTASVIHFENGEVLRASTEEWCVRRHLYSEKDTNAYINIGRILAQRCVESGLLEIYCNIKPPKEDGKIAMFLKAVTDGGVKLEEPPQFKKAQPWDQYRPEKPWDVIE